MSTEFAAPTVAWAAGRDDPAAPLVVLLHGRGSSERDIIGLAGHLPPGPSYVAVRAPIGEGGGYAWFANRGIGRPVAESLADAMAWFGDWLDDVAPAGRPVVLVGFSGGAAFAGGLVLSDPARYAGAAILYGTLPFEPAGMDVSPGRLAGLPVFVAQGPGPGDPRRAAHPHLGLPGRRLRRRRPDPPRPRRPRPQPGDRGGAGRLDRGARRLTRGAAQLRAGAVPRRASSRAIAGVAVTPCSSTETMTVKATVDHSHGSSGRTWWLVA